MKSLFFDIDGTLVNFQGKMPDSTRDALRQAKLKGHKIILCSGRSYCQIYPWLLNMDFDGVIAASGAYVTYGDKVIYEHGLQGEALQRVIEVMHNAQAKYMAQTPTKIFTRSEQTIPTFYKMQEASGQIDAEVIIDSKVQLREDIEKISFFESKIELDDVKSILSPYCEITAISFEKITNDAGEITAKGVTKALGIQKFIEYVGITQEDTISFGDSSNDHEMIEYTNIGVAMGNASDALKQKANFITKHIDEDGIYHAMVEMELL